ncbi:MAG: TRAP transporter small permease [Flavobacteriales bacterium]|nr:TRAP transporter small permease [Flavobacteriales bacterium]MDW8432836.1 TRAP transporter small permease [Flavobacteriales bacterium]
MRRYLSLNNWIGVLEKLLAILLISGIVVVVFAGTFSRYVLNQPIFGADRLATYAMVWLGFLGFQIATAKMRHIEVEFLKARVSGKVKAVMNMTACLLAALFLFQFAFYGYEYVVQSRELGDRDLVLDIPLWYIVAIIPVSFAISALRFFFGIFLWLEVFRGRLKEEEFVSKQVL